MQSRQALNCYKFASVGYFVNNWKCKDLNISMNSLLNFQIQPVVKKTQRPFLAHLANLLPSSQCPARNLQIKNEAFTVQEELQQIRGFILYSHKLSKDETNFIDKGNTQEM